MRLIDADVLQDEYVRLSGRELKLIDDAPTITEDEVVTTWVTRLLDEAKKYMTEGIENETN